MSIKFELGKKYVNRNGEVLECMRVTGSLVHLYYLDNISGYFVFKDGRFQSSEIHGLDIIAEYEQKEEEAKQTPKTVEDWLNTLPESYRKMAYANIIEQRLEGTLLLIGVDLKSAVGLFSWYRAKYPKHIKDAREMISFWSKVSKGELPPITKKQEQKTNDKYNRTIKDRTGKELGIVDVYCVGDAFGVDSKPLNHALKKILCAGTRGKGDEVQDLEEAIQAIQRRLMEIRK